MAVFVNGKLSKSRLGRHCPLTTRCPNWTASLSILRPVFRAACRFFPGFLLFGNAGAKNRNEANQRLATRHFRSATLCISFSFEQAILRAADHFRDRGLRPAIPNALSIFLRTVFTEKGRPTRLKSARPSPNCPNCRKVLGGTSLFSPDGRCVLITAEKDAKLISAATGGLIQQLPGEFELSPEWAQWHPYSRFSNDGKKIIVTSR